MSTSPSTYDLRRKLIEIARAELGTVETPPGSNRGPRVQQYQSACDYSKEAKTGWAWCAAFVCWCVREWLKDADVRAALGLKTLAEAVAWRPKTAAAWGLKDWAAKKGLLIMDDSMNNVLHTGDLVTFDFSHCALLETDEADQIYTIEGNTSPARGTADRDGGCVAAHVHPRSLARNFIRMLA